MTAEELRHEIEQTRRRLGETVDELAAKADMKARARAKAAEAKTWAQARAAEVSGWVRRSQLVQRRWPVTLAAGVVIAGSAAIWLAGHRGAQASAVELQGGKSSKMLAATWRAFAPELVPGSGS